MANCGDSQNGGKYPARFDSGSNLLRLLCGQQ
jgi:hypothetical protein